MNSLKVIDPTFSSLISETKDGKYTVKFKENQTYQLVGRSGSGKTKFIYNLLENAANIIDSTRDIEVLYCYKRYQTLFNEMKSKFTSITFHQGLLSTDEIFHEYSIDRNKHLIIIMDDLMRESIESVDLLDLFTVYCHHEKCSLLLTTHNLYQQGKYSRTLSLNAGYVILFDTPAGIGQIKYFGSHRFPLQPNMVVNAYHNSVVSKLFGYLVVDMTVNVPDLLRVRSGIFPGQDNVFYA